MWNPTHRSLEHLSPALAPSDLQILLLSPQPPVTHLSAEALVRKCFRRLVVVFGTFIGCTASSESCLGVVYATGPTSWDSYNDCTSVALTLTVRVVAYTPLPHLRVRMRGLSRMKLEQVGTCWL